MIQGIAIGEYLSIGKVQHIEPLGKINLFVGPNNSGKSNILRFINENLFNLYNTINATTHDAALQSRPHLFRKATTVGRLCVPAPLKAMEDLLKPVNANARKTLSKIHEQLTDRGFLWVHNGWVDKELVKRASTWVSHGDWHELWSHATRRTGGGIENWVVETLMQLRRLVPAVPGVYAIPIDREAGREQMEVPPKESTKVLGGKDVIRALAAMQNPDYATYDEDQSRFNAVVEFVRTVTDDAEAKINVPHKQHEIHVQLKRQSFLPLASLGSGIEQVVLHAVAATSVTDAVVTFEEPELHLHPVLQRQLMAFLAKKTTNQYFIATHSAHMIDAVHSDTFHVRLVAGETVVEKAETDAQRYRVCDDLGYRPSDIVQANCVVWVEGPSDRVYVRHWLKRADDHLQEHIHYSIMFYGGKLLSHLSAGETDTVDDGLEDLIQLRRLNRQIAVIIDSDLAAAGDSIRDTKARVVKEIGESEGFVWVSAGREIENYVPPDVLSAAVELVAPGRGSSVKVGQFERALPAVKPGATQTVDKVKTAAKVAEAGCGLDVLDLREQVQRLAAFIRAANGLPPIGG